MCVYRPISKVTSGHMISRTGGQASKYLFATNDVVTRIRVFTMIAIPVARDGGNLHLNGTYRLLHVKSLISFLFTSF